MYTFVEAEGKKVLQKVLLNGKEGVAVTRLLCTVTRHYLASGARQLRQRPSTTADDLHFVTKIINQDKIRVPSYILWLCTPILCGSLKASSRKLGVATGPKGMTHFQIVCLHVEWRLL